MATRHTTTEFACPQCGGNGFDVHEFPRGTYIQWFLNPGLAFNELILGQRIPRQMFQCLSCDLPALERFYIYCTQCATVHSGMLWGRGNALGHWFGLFCPDCGGRIPVFLNILSWVGIVALAPLWYPLWLIYRPRIIAWECGRARRNRGGRQIKDAVRSLTRTRRWLICGVLGFGLPMWVLQEFIFGRTGAFGWPAWVTLPVWLVGGGLWGWLMAWFVGRSFLRRPGSDDGRCRVCGYSLRGLVSDMCPECGYRLDGTEPTREDAISDRP